MKYEDWHHILLWSFASYNKEIERTVCSYYKQYKLHKIYNIILINLSFIYNMPICWTDQLSLLHTDRMDDAVLILKTDFNVKL